jgi:hypothetical protein
LEKTELAVDAGGGVADFRRMDEGIEVGMPNQHASNGAQR